MPRTIIVSICSREKDKNKKMLPARKRYLGSHIGIAEAAAQKDDLPFFILSGKHGLLAAGELVEYYDYLLDQAGVTNLVSRVCNQLNRIGAREVHFFTKTTPAWRPYRELLESAAAVLGVRVVEHELANNA